MTTRANLLAAAAFSIAGCNGQADPGVHTLDLSRVVVRPDTTSATDWLGRSRGLSRSPESGNLFTIHRSQRSILEFTSDGRFVRQYGRQGSGPGEMDHPSQVAVGQSRVVVLDTGNGKVLTFDQIEGTLLQEVNVAQPYRDLTLLGDSLIALVPGRGQKAFDLLSFGGKLLGSYGDGSQLPRSCAACQIVYLSVGLLAVIDSERPIIRFLGLDGERYNIVDFEHVEDLRKWRGEFRELIRNRSNAPAGKVWVADAVAVGEGRIALAVTPERVHERPRELWLVDAKEGLTARFRYDRVQVGYAISSFPDVFTIGLRDGAIYVFGPSSNWR